MKTGIELIAEERERQVSKEKYDADHDDSHGGGSILAAGIAYATAAQHQSIHGKRTDFELVRTMYWPWSKRDWKPSPDRVRNLVKAAALLAAEIDREQRFIAELDLAVLKIANS